MAQFKQTYYDHKGHYPSALGEIFGFVGQAAIFNVCDALYAFTDDLFPDNIPLVSTVQDVLMAVYKAVYHFIGQYYYDDWAWSGDQITAKFDDIIADYKAKVNQAVNDAKALVERDLINPLKAKIDTLNAQISIATANLDNVNRMIDSAKKTLTEHGVRLQYLEAKINTNNPLANLEKIFKK
jgi:hypothetical protein